MRVIYVIQNTINGKRYVGQTKRPSVRRNQHWKCRNENLPLVRAMLKHDHDNFTFTIIEECEDEMSDERECHWIREYRTTEYDFGYNLESGGNATKELGEETRKRISEAQRAWHQNASPEEKRRWLDSRAHVKFPDTPEFRQMISNLHKGKPKSLEHRAKMSQAHMGKRHKQGCTCNVHKSKRRVFSDEKEKELVEKFTSGESARVLADEHSVHINTIWRVLNRHGIKRRQIVCNAPSNL